MFIKNIPDNLNQSSIIVGDALKILRQIPSESVQSVITSPPYWGMRDYEMAGQIGAESDLIEYLDSLISVFREVKRVLKIDGTLWINIGDGYTSGNRKYRASDKKNPARQMQNRPDTPEGLKPKDLIGIPWRLAFALQQDGWYLRSDIIWHKPNAMPESVHDRPNRNHEYLFMFSKSEKYYFNSDALIENGKRRRSVWEVPIKKNALKHNAVFPPDLISPCVQSCTEKPGDMVLDPFFGSGTVGFVCEKYNRNYIGIELNPAYANVALTRLKNVSATINNFDRTASIEAVKVEFSGLKQAI